LPSYFPGGYSLPVIKIALNRAGTVHGEEGRLVAVAQN
jgi:hypothetical protein